MTKIPMRAALTVLALTIAGCSTATEPYQASEKSQAELAEALAGRTQGKPQQCIPNFRSTEMHVIDDQTILYRDGQTVYVQHPRSPCNGLKFGTYTMVTRQFGTSQLCDGDINNMVDLRTGMMGGACVFGPFVPYTKPE